MAEKRKLFEEVTQAAPPPSGGMLDARGGGARGAVRLWLAALFALVTLMILVGGLTRLTDSGLSITEWAPILGAIPPLSAADWAEAFERYQAIPEYTLQNKGMDLDAFKAIYWWEWGHRQLGRLVGLVWALGFVWFAARGQVPPGWTRRLLALGALGGLQGALGWWMVSSGLAGGRVDVASTRLALHLGLAFAILGLIGWNILALGRSEAALIQSRRAGERRLQRIGAALMHLAFLQILLGALVAGTDAGRGFPTWPDMNGRFFPADAFHVPGGAPWQAFFENPGLVQFNHRMAAYALIALGLLAYLRGRASAHLASRRAFAAVLLMLALQAGLGIAAALTAAPLGLSLAHQAGAVLLWALILRARFLSTYPITGTIRGGTL